MAAGPEPDEWSELFVVPDGEGADGVALPSLTASPTAVVVKAPAIVTALAIVVATVEFLISCRRRQCSANITRVVVDVVDTASRRRRPDLRVSPHVSLASLLQIFLSTHLSIWSSCDLRE